MAELVGPHDSGRTRTLLRLRDAVPGALLLDATGLTSEDLVAQVMQAAGVDFPQERRADWGWALGDSSFAGGLVVIANAQRAGRTRRSSEPERMVHRFAIELAVAGRLKVVIERDLPDARAWHGNLVVAIQPAAGQERPERQQLAGVDADALRALALAEVRRAPLTVWTALAQALESQTGRPVVDVAVALESASELLEADTDGWVSFRDERVAEALRRDNDPEVVRAVNLAFVDWLRTRPAADVATALYLSQGLAMHAVQAGQFDSVQRSGRLVAHLDQVALIDAAHCDDPYRVDHGSPGGDAVNLWMCGVDSLSQGEWASWLHLMSTARGDHATAADIAASGLNLPWRVRWAHWRPPGAMSAAFVRPGPLHQLAVAPDDYWPGRTAVIAQGDWDRRYRVWDAGTGEALAGPWPDSVPTPGVREPLWLPDVERDVTPAWIDLTEYDSLSAPFVSDQVAVGDVTVVTGLGGIFAVEATGSAHAPVLGTVHGEPMLDDRNFVCALQDRARQPQGAYDPALFEPGVVRRLPSERLPEDVTDPDTCRILTEAGLPAFEGVEMRLLALDEQGLTPLDAESLPAGAPHGTYYTFGVWGGGEVALQGSTGQVFLLSAGRGGVGGQAELVADSLASFIELLQHYVVARCMLASAGSRVEREAIRDDLEISLSSIDEAGTAAGLWMAGLSETD
ncbi:SUKH-4 family immunity protein [Streptomyces sp. AC550_RSS872]|uniref:SUKH-4 family immunity protein n=1 Tax=Streptomyces sp. AC550_RSS872 TaxID=2823689 RepID=UPI001C254C1D|nr:SUKH-4 family immunity protein [Streptomyces sp. AC550_RSS872]